VKLPNELTDDAAFMELVNLVVPIDAANRTDVETVIALAHIAGKRDGISDALAIYRREPVSA
jgi:hypothetical protein